MRLARDGVERVVHEVAHDRDQPARVDQAVGQPRAVGDPQGDTALDRDGRLADQQGGEQWVLDLLGHLLRGRPVIADHLPDEVHRVVVHLQFEQPQQRVHAVGVLVVLGAQRVDEAVRRVEFAPELLQLGAVAQGGHGAAVVGGHAVDDQHALPADGDQVRTGHPARQDIGRPSVAERFVGRVAHHLLPDAEEALGLVVEQPDPAGAVQGDDAFPDAVQHRLTLGEQRRDVREGQVAGLSLDPPGDQPGGQRAHGEGPARVGEQSGDRMDQAGAHAVVLDADRDRADDLVVTVAQGYLAAGRAAQGAAVDLHDVLARQGLARIRRHMATDLLGVGVRPAGAVQVHDHDVLRAAGLADPLGLTLHRSVDRRLRARRSSAICGTAAVVCAMARARRIAWSSS